MKKDWAGGGYHHLGPASTLIALEPRYLFDAAGVLTALHVAVDHVHDSDPHSPTVDAHHRDSASSVRALFSHLADTPPAETDSGTTLLIVDPRVQDYQSLIADLDPSVQVYVLDPTRDGVSQISEILAESDNVSSLQILSHGGVGKVYLGTTVLDAQSLDAYAGELAQWDASLSDGADILLYGCQVGADDAGIAFVNHLGELTGADIAASDDITGAGGDWVLEVTSGNLSSPQPFDPVALASYEYSLAVVTWDGGGDGVHWSDPLNWSTDNVPGDEVGEETLDVVINDPIGDASAIAVVVTDPIHVNSITVDGSLNDGAALVVGNDVTANAVDVINGAGLTINSGTLDLSGAPDSTFQMTVDASSTLTLNAGALQIADYPTYPVEIVGAFNWYGGTISGLGQVNLRETATLTIDAGAGNVTLEAAALSLAGGTIEWNSGDLVMDPASAIYNGAGSQININGDLTLIDNTGTVRTIGNFAGASVTKTAGTGTATVPGLISSAGATVTSEQGTLRIVQTSDALTQDGTFDGAGYIEFATANDATTVFEPGSSITTTYVSFDGDAVVNGTFQPGGGEGGGTYVRSGTVQLNGANTGLGAYVLVGPLPFVGDPLPESQGLFLNTSTADLSGLQGIAVLSGTLDLGGNSAAAYQGIYLADGVIRVGPGQSLATGSFGLDMSGGRIELDGGTLQVGAAEGGTYLSGGTIAGSGNVMSDYFNSGGGIISPGLSPGEIDIIGNWIANYGSTTAVEIGGTTPGSGYDQIAVSGDAELAGQLSVSLIDGFVPSAGDSFVIVSAAGAVSGQFGSGDLEDISAYGLEWQIGYEADQVVLTAVPIVHAAADSASTSFGDPLTVDVLANDANGNGDPLSVSAVGVPVSYSLQIVPTIGEGPNFDNPQITLTNQSATAQIDSVTITIGDTTRDFSSLSVTDSASLDSVTENAPAGTPGDQVDLAFAGFDPGESLVFEVSLDQDGQSTYEDFSQVFFGNGTAANATITVQFSDGTVLTQTLPELPSDQPDGSWQFVFEQTGVDQTAGVPPELTLNADNTISYTPAVNFVGTQTFAYAVTDGNGNFDSTTLTVDVTLPPNTVYWTAGGDGTSWADDLNWSSDDAPGNDPGEETLNVVINDVNGALPVDLTSGAWAINSLEVNGETVDLSGAMLSIASAATFDAASTLDISGGATLTGNGNITVNGTLDWTADTGATDTISGTGTLTTTDTATTYLTGSGTGNLSLERDWDNYGTVYYDFNNISAQFEFNSSGATLTNEAGATFYFIGSESDMLGGGAFVNDGTVVRDSAGQIIIQASFDNNGTVIANNGMLSLDGGGASTGGTFTSNGGAVELAGGTHSLTDVTFDGSVTTLIRGGTVTLSGTDNTAVNLHISGGATVNGDGDLTVSGNLFWVADTGATSTIGGTGTLTTTITTTTNLTGNGTGNLSLERNWDNYGIVDYNFGNTAAQLEFNGSGATLTNEASAILFFVGAASPVASGGTIVNQGAVIRDSSGTLTINASFINNGTVTATSGTLDFAAGSFSQDGGSLVLNGGTLSSDGGAGTFSIDGGTVRGSGTIQGGLSFTGASPGTLYAGNSIGALDITGDLTLAANTTVIAQLESAASYDVIDVGGNVDFGGATLDVGGFNGYTPSLGDSFQILTWTGAATGSFGAIGQDPAFDVGASYGATDLTLTVDVVYNEWVGTSGGWGDATNWSLGVVPDASQEVIIDVDGTQTITVDDGSYQVFEHLRDGRRSAGPRRGLPGDRQHFRDQRRLHPDRRHPHRDRGRQPHRQLQLERRGGDRHRHHLRGQRRNLRCRQLRPDRRQDPGPRGRQHGRRGRHPLPRRRHGGRSRRPDHRGLAHLCGRQRGARTPRQQQQQQRVGRQRHADTVRRRHQHRQLHHSYGSHPALPERHLHVQRRTDQWQRRRAAGPQRHRGPRPDRCGQQQSQHLRRRPRHPRRHR